MKSFADFEIWIDAPRQGETSRFPVQVVISPADLPAGEMELDITAVDFQKDLYRVTGVYPDFELRKSFGKRLFDALFRGAVRDAWESSIGSVNEGLADVLRLRLLINPSQVAALPWELLWSKGFLATASDRVISRYLPVREPPTLVVQRPLRILLVVERPEGLPEIKQSEVDELETAIGHIVPNVEFKTLLNPRVSDIQDALQQDFHVFHFLGHGTAGKLVLVGDDGSTPMPIADNEFAQLFLGRRNLRLVVLNACNSAQGDDEGLFSGVGPALVQKRIPAVVAMQYPFVLLDTASKFSKRFYRALGHGLPVDVAVNEARQFISAGQQLAGRDWSTPVLYMGTRSGKILDLSEDSSVKSSESQEQILNTYIQIEENPFYVITKEGSKVIIRSVPAALQNPVLHTADALYLPSLQLDIKNRTAVPVDINSISFQFSSLKELEPPLTIIVGFLAGAALERRRALEMEHGLLLLSEMGDYRTYLVRQPPEDRQALLARLQSDTSLVQFADFDVTGAPHREWRVTESVDVKLERSKRIYERPVRQYIDGHSSMTVPLVIGSDAPVQAIGSISIIYDSGYSVSPYELDLVLEPPAFVKQTERKQ